MMQRRVLITPHVAPDHAVYPYLLRGVTIARTNHVWATDITYVPMARGFAYLVAIIDWDSLPPCPGVASVQHAGHGLSIEVDKIHQYLFEHRVYFDVDLFESSRELLVLRIELRLEGLFLPTQALLVTAQLRCELEVTEGLGQAGGTQEDREHQEYQVEDRVGEEEHQHQRGGQGNGGFLH
jgi:hypothetical protein